MKNIIGKNVQKAREKIGLTQEQFAIRLEMAGWKVDRFLISKIERGERQILDKEVQMIADALQVSIASLFSKEK